MNNNAEHKTKTTKNNSIDKENGDYKYPNLLKLSESLIDSGICEKDIIAKLFKVLFESPEDDSNFFK
jgi:hypothetical protein